MMKNRIFNKSLEFFAFVTKLPEMVMLASKDFTAAKKVPIVARADPGFNPPLGGGKGHQHTIVPNFPKKTALN